MLVIVQMLANMEVVELNSHLFNQSNPNYFYRLQANPGDHTFLKSIRTVATNRVGLNTRALIEVQ